MKRISQTIRAFLFCAAAIGFGTTTAVADPIYYLYTGQTGAQTQIDLDHTTTWLIETGGSAFDFGGGNFVVKKGSQTFEDIDFDLYLGGDATTTPVATVSLTISGFCALHPGNCQSFDVVPFHFVTPYTLLANTTYFAALSSGADDPQNEAYFIKGIDDSQIHDEAGNPPPGDVAVVPEPATLALLGLGLAGLGFSRRKQ